MKVYFKHKELGVVFSLNGLKSKLDYVFSFKNYFYNPPKEFKCEGKDILFSDDFEIICEQEEFNSDELHILREALYTNPYLVRNNEVSQLINKLGKMRLNKDMLNN